MARPKRTGLGYHTSNGNGGWRIRFQDVSGKRKSIWLGDIPEDQANTWCMHVNHLIYTQSMEEPPAPATARWIATLSLAAREKLERVGLVTQTEASRARTRKRTNQPPETLGPFLDWYIAGHSANAKPRTVVKWKHGKESLLRFFQPSRRLDSITHADAMSWRNWLASNGNNKEGKEREDKAGNITKGRTTLADATVRRRTGQARQFFNYAVKAKLIETNPFSELPATVYGNDERKHFVTKEVTKLILEHAPGAEWEAIIALARYGGLRAPSEVMRLKWEDIDFARGRMCIHSPKTEHHRNKGIRYCPIFPELWPYLESLAELANHRGAKPTDYVITKPRGSESVLTQPFKRILKKAGVPVYPKPLQNLRASRETELLDEFPLTDVCSWIGNSPKVAMEHYAMTRQESFDRATGLAKENFVPIHWPISGNSSHLTATGEGGARESESAFDQGKPRSNPLLASLGNWGQLPLNRPGRT